MITVFVMIVGACDLITERQTDGRGSPDTIRCNDGSCRILPDAAPPRVLWNKRSMEYAVECTLISSRRTDRRGVQRLQDEVHVLRGQGLHPPRQPMDCIRVIRVQDFRVQGPVTNCMRQTFGKHEKASHARAQKFAATSKVQHAHTKTPSGASSLSQPPYRNCDNSQVHGT